MAHRRSSRVCLGELTRDGSASSSTFGVLDPLGDGMDLGFAEKPSPHDLVMFDPGVHSLKRGCSPLKMSKSSSTGLLPTKSASSPMVFVIA